jgi:hypothetical protein
MSNPIKPKSSATPGKVPLTSDLALGEIAVNTHDGKLFMKRNNGSDEVVEIGAVPVSFTELTAAAGQTVFTATYRAGRALVILNGRVLPPTSYTASNGTSVTIPTAATGDAVLIISI